jgi:hypothetical protein
MIPRQLIRIVSRCACELSLQEDINIRSVDWVQHSAMTYHATKSFDSRPFTTLGMPHLFSLMYVKYYSSGIHVCILDQKKKKFHEV